MNYLLVVAHPDDEVLGAGATVRRLVDAGHIADVCILSSSADARNFRPGDEELNSDLKECAARLGIRNIYEGSFPNIKLNNVAHLELVQYIEQAIKASRPDVIITHHPSDTNNDHLHTSLACQAAARLFQRISDIPPLQELWFMETPSSTDWAINTSMNRFMPNMYVEIGEEGVAAKLRALSAYRGVMRDYPHPRSEEFIRGLAATRGGESGCRYAEAFECVFRRITNFS